eukprot:s108_g9.t1
MFSMLDTVRYGIETKTKGCTYEEVEQCRNSVSFYRPMQEDLLAYATQDVMYLPLLHRRLCDQLGDTTGNNVLSRSRQYVNYSKMNLHLSSPKAAERRGLRLQAMLATHTEAALYFKLNLGAHRQGVVSREEALKNFKDMHYGDIAECWVSAWNTGGNILFLERLEAGHTFPADPDFTTGKMGRRKRRRCLPQMGLRIIAA